MSARQGKRLLKYPSKELCPWGYSTDPWTMPRVGEFIGEPFGVRYHPVYVRKILREEACSCEELERPPCRRDEEAILWWRTDPWPQMEREKRGWDHCFHQQKRLHASTGSSPHLGATRPYTPSAPAQSPRPAFEEQRLTMADCPPRIWPRIFISWRGKWLTCALQLDGYAFQRSGAKALAPGPVRHELLEGLADIGRVALRGET